MVSAPLATLDPASSNKERLRLWIRLLRASRIVEGELRERLKGQFNSTLPRFDVMAALYREPNGMLMSDLSRFLLVSNGNVTGIVDRLVSDGFVVRAQREGDRRTSIVRLTARLPCLASRDGDRLSGDRGRALAAQPENRGGNLVGLHEAALRVAGHQARAGFFHTAAGLFDDTADGVLQHVGFDVTRAYRVDCHACLHQFDG